MSDSSPSSSSSSPRCGVCGFNVPRAQCRGCFLYDVFGDCENENSDVAILIKFFGNENLRNKLLLISQEDRKTWISNRVFEIKAYNADPIGGMYRMMKNYEEMARAQKETASYLISQSRGLDVPEMYYSDLSDPDYNPYSNLNTEAVTIRKLNGQVSEMKARVERFKKLLPSVVEAEEDQVSLRRRLIDIYCDPISFLNGHQLRLFFGTKATAKKLQKPEPWALSDPVTRFELADMRNAFWDGAPHSGGREEIWDALRAAAAQEDTTLALAIVDAAGIIVQAPDLSVCFDESGFKYELPRYVLSEPTNMDR